MQRRKAAALVFILVIVLLLVILCVLAWILLSGMKARAPAAQVVKDSASSQPQPGAGGGIEVYFCPRDHCMEKMIAAINASTDIRCAFYELNLPELISLLRQKSAQVVIEDDNKIEGFMTGYSDALMHNKFCVLDGRTVTTGSMNPTLNDNYYNNNNLVIIRSEALAKNYLDEFDELKNNIYGKGNKVKNPVVDVSGIRVENYFCPEDNCKLHVLDALKAANESIYFMDFSFTDEDIGNMVYNKAYLGLKVRGIFETRQLSDFSEYYKLFNVSILDRNPHTMHHKVFVIDGKVVVTGSFNPTSNANERNDENIVIIYDRKIAQEYIDEFNVVWNMDYETIPSVPGKLVMSRVVYDPPGADTGAEYVELYNGGGEGIDLDYYGLTDNSTSKKLTGYIAAGERKQVKSPISLKNSNGQLILTEDQIPVDYVAWEGKWALAAKEGFALERTDYSRISEDAWAVVPQ